MRTLTGLVAIAIVLALPAGAETSIDSPEMLMERLNAALEDRDAGRLDRMYFWEGVDAEHAATIRETFETRFFECEARPTQVVPGQFGKDEYVRGGVRYRPNLEIVGRIDFRCTSGKRASFQAPYGRRDGQYFLVNVARDPVNP